MKSAITHDLYEVDGAVVVGDLTSGPKLPLGTLALIGPAVSDEELYYVKAGAGAATDGDVVGKGNPQYIPAATDEAVVQYVKNGESIWVYVEVGASGLRRGEIATATTAGTRVVTKAPASAETLEVVGVAQHNIPANSHGWILREGVGVLQTTGVVAALDALVTSATSGVASTAAAKDHSFAYALTAGGVGFSTVNGQDVTKCHIACVG